MKNKRFLILTIFILMLVLGFNNTVLADTCSNEEKKELRTIAGEIKVEAVLKPAFTTYEEIVNNKSGVLFNAYSYDIVVYNLTKDFYVEINKVVKPPINGSITFNNIYSGGGINAKVNIYAANKPCFKELIVTLPVYLEHYNAYSLFPECEGNTDKYKICSPRLNTMKYTDESFRKELAIEKKKYEENHKEKVVEEPKKESKVLSFLNEYKVPIITLIVLVVLIIIYKTYKDKNSIKVDLGDI